MKPASQLDKEITSPMLSMLDILLQTMASNSNIASRIIPEQIGHKTFTMCDRGLKYIHNPRL